MKNNQPHETSFEKIPLADILGENPWIQWISENGRNLLILFLILISLFFVVFQISSNRTTKSELNFINAENDYQRFIAETNPAKAQEILTKLNSILTAYPELKPKYDGLIAEKLIIEGNLLPNLEMATSAIERTKSENAPFYTDYSETTLLIAQKKYEEALKKSLALNEALILNLKSEPETLLMPFNLLRIGTLQQLLGLQAEELKTWNEWNLKGDNQSFKNLVNQFNIEKVSLTNYIETREKFLKKS